MVVIDKGSVLEQGTYDDLNSTDGGEIQRLLSQISQSSDAKKSKSPTESHSETERSDKIDGTLIKKEERSTGAVPLSMYVKYLQAGGRLLRFGVVLIGYTVTGVNTLLSTVWIALWTKDATYEKQPQSFYLGIYAGLAVTLSLFTYLRTILLVHFGIRASTTLHRNLLQSILNAPQSFFDTTPVGRILSRFSKDMYSLDLELSAQLDIFLFCVISIIFNLATIFYI